MRQNALFCSISPAGVLMVAAADVVRVEGGQIAGVADRGVRVFTFLEFGGRITSGRHLLERELDFQERVQARR